MLSTIAFTVGANRANVRCDRVVHDDVDLANECHSRRPLDRVGENDDQRRSPGEKGDGGGCVLSSSFVPLQ